MREYRASTGVAVYKPENCVEGLTVGAHSLREGARSTLRHLCID